MTAPQRAEYEVRGLKLAYHTWASPAGDDSPLLLFHGFSDHGLSFAPMVRALRSKRHRIIAPDFRGHGHSGWIGAGGYYAFYDYFDDMRRLVDRLKLERVSIVGHSMGGSIATGLAAMLGARVERLLLLEGMGPPFHDPADALNRIVRWSDVLRRTDVDLDVEGRRNARRKMASVEEAASRLQRANPRLPADIARELAASFTEPPTSFAEPAMSVAEPATGTGFAEPAGEARAEGAEDASAAAVVWRFDPLHRTPAPRGYRADEAEVLFRSVSCPVLSVVGEASPFADDTLERRHAWLQDGRAAVLKGAGHNLHHEQPEATAAIVDWWIGGHGEGEMPACLHSLPGPATPTPATLPTLPA
ncbi:MAG: alpha/beta hydrolase [Deltaproteobacteria bacterium]|nr:alpha/beta hydrolase [Deltaproteobacteria bacterium]